MSPRMKADRKAQRRRNWQLYWRAWREDWLFHRAVFWDDHQQKWRRWADGVNWLLTPLGKIPMAELITYKGGWSPARFRLPYATTYLLGTLWGCYGISSLSRIWYERSQYRTYNKVKYRWPNCPSQARRKSYPVSYFLTRFLNWATRGKHGANTGPAFLWGSRRA